MSPALIALALAAASPPDPVLTLALASGPALDRLQRLAAEAGVAISFRPDDLRGRVAPALAGRMRLSTALRRTCASLALRCNLTTQGILVERAAPARVRAPVVPMRRPTSTRVLNVAPAPEETIVVTGRRGVGDLTDAARSFSLTRIDGPRLDRGAGGSIASLLTAVPGLWVDDSAGTSANTIRVRGIPLDGYQAIAVQENGLPVQHDTLPWTDIDQFVRPDIMLEAVDYVRGGPAVVFASKATGGLLNLRTRSPATTPGGGMRLTTTDYGLTRLDAYVTGALGSGWRGIAGGYLARDPSPRRIARALGGGQLRLRADRELGGGTISLGLRLLDDDTLNISSYPIRRARDGALRGLPGFDPRRGSWFGGDLDRVTFATEGGPQTRSVGRNNVNRLIAPDVSAVLPLGDATRFVARGRLRRSVTARHAILSSGPPVAATDLIAGATPRLVRAFPTTASVTLRRAASGEPFAAATGNDLVVVVQPTVADIRTDEAVGDISLSRRFAVAGQHELTLGVYADAYRWHYRRRVARALVEARSQGRLLDLLALGADGAIAGAATDAGFLSRAATYEQLTATTRTAAVYVADEWQVEPAWRLDLGVRHERARIVADVDPGRTVDGRDPRILADDALRVAGGTRRRFAVASAGTSATLALHWQAAPDTGMFLRGTSGMRLPDPGIFRATVPTGAVPTRVRQAEAGALWRRERLSLDATLFASRFDDLTLADTAIDPVTGAIMVYPQPITARTLGMETEARWRPSSWLALDFAATIQDPIFLRHDIAERDGAPRHSLAGRTPRRLPRIMGTLAVTADIPGSALVLSADVRAAGRRWADDANTLSFPGFAVLGAGAEWRPRPGWRWSVRANNLLDAIVPMQGDATAGDVRAALGASDTFIGRTLAGRSVQLALTWSAR